MQSRACILYLFVVAAVPITGLKLLIHDNGDEDEVWEADIKFAVKPLLGKCLKADGNALNGAVAAGSSNAGKLTANGCEAVSGVPASDVKKYCTEVTEAVSCTSSCSQYRTVGEAAKTLYLDANKPKWNFKKYVHYMAKLASMLNLELTAHEQAASKMIEAFEVTEADGAYKFFVNPPAKANDAAGSFCYGTASIAWAKNDPIVKNIAGEEFEIMATGTFQLLTLQNTDSTKMFLQVAATIDRAGTRCGATYIQNITLEGQWVEDVGVPKIQFRATPAVPKHRALEANFEGRWQPAAANWRYAAVREANVRKFVLKLHEIQLNVSIDSHRIQELNQKTSRFANFLNINFEGISNLSGQSVGGLLGRDPHDDAAAVPEGCNSVHLLSHDSRVGFLSEMHIN